MDRFRVQLVRDLGTRLAVVWDAGSITAEDEQTALIEARSRLSAMREDPFTTAVTTHWRVVRIPTSLEAGLSKAAPRRASLTSRARIDRPVTGHVVA